MLQMVAICPHPPIIIPEIGKEEIANVEKTVNGMKEIAQKIKSLNPDLLVFITPHGPVFQDAISISKSKSLSGSFSNFGSNITLEREFDEEFSQELVKKSKDIKAFVAELNESLAVNYGIKLELDHGILVPLYYLDRAGVNVPIVPINMGMLPFPELYEFGICLQKAINDFGKKVIIVISGDLSHRLLPNAPAGFDPQAKVFDEIIVQSVNEGDVLRVLNIDSNLIQKAGECGLRPIIMGLGALDGFEIESKIYSYEGPFGVGYLIAELLPKERVSSRKLLKKILESEENKIKKTREKESWPVKWARKNLENYLLKGSLAPIPEDVPEEFLNKKGVFVSIKKNGQLRGCIGTIWATTDSIVREIQENVLKAALDDPRFEPISEDELESLVYSVDILEKPEPVENVNQLDPQKYGVIVSKGYKKGLLLPMLDGIDTVEEQIEIAKEKAGLAPDEEVKLERFKVTRYK